MKAALYIRVSTHFQVDKDSLPFQRQELINYSKYALGIDSYEVFEDAGYSAKNTDRPAYQDMMARVRQKEFTHVFVWKIDRVSRNLLDFAKMYDELKKYNTIFISKNEQFDTSSAMGEAMLKIILVFAELERKLTAERVTSIMLSRAQKGLWNGATVPLGYEWSDELKFPVLCESEANIVKTIYELYLKVCSTTKVASHLNAMHLPTKRGGTWTAKTINDILRNPFYIGTYRYNVKDQKRRWKAKDEWVILEDNHEPLIAKHIFEKVQEILKGNYKGDSQYQRENIHTHIFSGLIYCNKCGARFWAGLDSSRKDGYRPSRYVCYKNQTSCSNFIGDVTLLPFMLNYIANFLRLQNKITSSYSIRSIEKALIRGKFFGDIIGIDDESLTDTQLLLTQGCASASFDGLEEGDVTIPNTSEREILEKEKLKFEKALERLESLYLFAEESMSKKDFIFKKADLMKQLEQINLKVKTLNRQCTTKADTDSPWIDNAQYFLLTTKLQKTLFVDYRELLRLIDVEVIQEFMKSIISEIHVADKKIMSITFCNGITHKFAYKEKTMHPTRERLLYRKYEADLLALLQSKKEVTRKDIEDLTGLGKSSVGKLLSEFMERGIICRVGHSVSTYYTLIENSDISL